MRVVIDTDPGVDDALALLLAARSPELDVVGVTTVAGNVLVDQCARNARAIIGAAGIANVPVATGADRPLVGRLTTATHFHGPNGLGGLDLPDVPALAAPVTGAELLVRAAMEGEPLTVIALGPLTNLALACRLDPRWLQRVQRIVVMGGAIGVPGNVTPVAEANVYADPEAAAIVLRSGAPITLVGLDVTTQTLLSPSRWNAVRTLRAPAPVQGVEGLARALLDFYLTRAVDPGGPALHDPLAVAVACDPSLVMTRRLAVEVECRGEHTRGQTVAWLTGKRERVESHADYDDVVGIEDIAGTIDVALEVDVDRFLDLFFDRLFPLANGPSSWAPASS